MLVLYINVLVHPCREDWQVAPGWSCPEEDMPGPFCSLTYAIQEDFSNSGAEFPFGQLLHPTQRAGAKAPSTHATHLKHAQHRHDRHVMENRLRGRYITWYIDNTSAASAAIKGASPTEDNSPMALIAALLAASMGCRIWVEYIASAQNPSDVLSREAYDDEDVRRKLASGDWVRLQTKVDWSAALTISDAQHIVQRWGVRDW